MKKNILISFVIPAHNEEESIGLCLEPIINQMSSIKEGCEIIVVNDGSTDNTKEVVERYSQKQIKLLNFATGHSAAFSRNRGSEIARGKYLVFLDADQIIQEDFIKRLRDILLSECHDILGMFVLPYKPKTIFQKAWAGFRNAHYCGALIFKRELFLKFKFDERIFYIEDNDLRQRFEKSGYRIHYTGLKVYHIDTETWADFVRQRKWHGKGIICWLKIKKKYFPLRYFVPCLFALFALFPIGWLRIIPLVFYLCLSWLYYWIKSKEMINSFLWVTIDYLGRFISLYYFIKDMLLNQNSYASPK